MKKVNHLNKTITTLSTTAVVLLSTFGVATLANATDNFINASAGAKDAKVGIANDTSIGSDAKANDGNTSVNTGGATAVGADTEASGAGATVLGRGAKAIGSYNSALGNMASATGSATTAVGVSAQASGAHSVAVGSNAKATGYSSVGIGLATTAGSGATGSSAVSIGDQAGASIQDSVALGSYSRTTVNSNVHGYDPSTGNKTDATWKATKGAVSIGDVDNQITRQITSVAAGTNDTDAVNVAQLKSLDGKVEKNKADIATNKADIATNKADIATINSKLSANNNSINELRGNVNLLNKDLRGGVASAIAHASVPQSTKAGAVGVGVGGGFYGGQSAVSLGVSGVTSNEKWVFKASVSSNSRGNYGVGVGALYQW